MKERKKESSTFFLGCTNFWQCEKQLILRLLLLALLYFTLAFFCTSTLEIFLLLPPSLLLQSLQLYLFSPSHLLNNNLRHSERDTQLCSVTGTKIATRRRRKSKERIETLLLPPRQQTANKLLETSEHTETDRQRDRQPPPLRQTLANFLLPSTFTLAGNSGS